MAELKISDLSVGDWVKIQGVIREIDYLYGKNNVCDTPIEFVEPIPITPEILEKNGWSEFSDYHNSWKLDIASDKRVWMFKNSHDWTFQVMSWGLGHNHSVAKAYIKDIHELQHALRLAGIEKDIEL
jgi:hypothetical protein